MAYVLIFLGLVIALLSIFRNSLPKGTTRWSTVVLCSLAIIFAFGQFYVTWSRKQIESALKAYREYSDIAKLDLAGQSFHKDEGVIYPTLIAKMLQGSVSVTRRGNNQYWYQPKCDSESQETYQKVINAFPKFPFSYSSLAMCLRLDGNEHWKEYANKSLEILNKTTTIEGHNELHDATRSELLQWLYVGSYTPPSKNIYKHFMDF